MLPLCFCSCLCFGIKVRIYMNWIFQRPDHVGTYCVNSYYLCKLLLPFNSPHILICVQYACVYLMIYDIQSLITFNFVILRIMLHISLIGYA
jgi:hypothetical protein